MDELPGAMLAAEDFGDAEFVGDGFVFALHTDRRVLDAGPEAQVAIVAGIEDFELAVLSGRKCDAPSLKDLRIAGPPLITPPSGPKKVAVPAPSEIRSTGSESP